MRRSAGRISLCALAALAVCVGNADAAGGGIWLLGPEVERQPKLIFLLFVAVVLLTMILEWIKHKIEHATHGTHRGEALSGIFSELMMIGVISFLLILVGEFGVSGLHIPTPCVDPLAPAPPSAAPRRQMSVLEAMGRDRHRFSVVEDDLPATRRDHALGKGDDPAGRHGRALEITATDTLSEDGDVGGSRQAAKKCFFSITLLLLEYAHLVLFFMGIAYGCFIQIAFYQRNRAVADIKAFQSELALSEVCSPVGSWGDPSVWCASGMGTTRGWRKTVLCLRNAFVLQHEERLARVCSSVEYEVEVAIADITGGARPAVRSTPDKVAEHFDFSRYVHKAQAVTLVELVHVPPVVWLGICAISALNLVYYSGISLPYVLLFASFLTPLMAVGLVLRMGAQLRAVVRGAVGHTLIDTVNHQHGVKDVEGGKGVSTFTVPPFHAFAGREWADGHSTPWDVLTGCCEDGSTFDFLDVNDPGALKVQIQMTVFSTCFFIGQLGMLAVMVIEELGVAGFLFIAFVSLFPLVVVLPKAILLYTLTHCTREPPRTWLVASMRTGDAETGKAHLHSAIHRLHRHLDGFCSSEEFQRHRRRTADNPETASPPPDRQAFATATAPVSPALPAPHTPDSNSLSQTFSPMSAPHVLPNVSLTSKSTLVGHVRDGDSSSGRASLAPLYTRARKSSIPQPTAVIDFADGAGVHKGDREKHMRSPFSAFAMSTRSFSRAGRGGGSPRTSPLHRLHSASHSPVLCNAPRRAGPFSTRQTTQPASPMTPGSPCVSLIM